MHLNEIEKYDKIFAGWSRKALTVTRQMIQFLEDQGVSQETFIEYVDLFLYLQRIGDEISKKAFILRTRELREIRKDCPECGIKMNIEPVNNTNCTQINNKKLNAVWSCEDERGCGYQEFTKKTVNYYFQKAMERFKAKHGGKTIEEILNIPIVESDVAGGLKLKSSKCRGR